MNPDQHICIICRESGKEMSDEHIIPKALGGKVHSYRVCKECNSKLGDNVDIHLTNHWFSQFFRHRFKIKGNSGDIPHPLIGDGTLEDGTKVKTVLDEKGILRVKYLPTKPIVSEDGMSFSFSVDAVDEKEIGKIKSKMLKRLGIDSKLYGINEHMEHKAVEQPMVKSSIGVDIINYKIGLLKIAYEFACENVTDYFQSDDAKIISSILHHPDIDKVKVLNLVSESFFDQQRLFLDEFIDYSKIDRHVLILFNANNDFYCFVRIGDVFRSVVRLANTSIPIPEEMINLVDDLDKTAPQTYTFKSLIEKTIKSSCLGFRFDETIEQSVEHLLGSRQIGISCNKFNDYIFYDSTGVAKITTQDLLKTLEMAGNFRETSMDDSGVRRTTYAIPTGLFYKGMPGEYLIPVKEIFEEQTIEKV